MLEIKVNLCATERDKPRSMYPVLQLMPRIAAQLFI